MPEQVQDRGVQVVDADAIDGGLVADFVGCAVGVPPLTPPPASQVVKACGLWSRPGLAPFCASGKPAEFAAPDDQRRIQQAAGFQIGQQAGDRLIGFAGEAAVVAGDVDVAVPAPFVLLAAGVDLHEPHAAFDHPPGDQALLGEMAALRIVEPVELLRRGRFAVESSASGAAICMR